MAVSAIYAQLGCTDLTQSIRWFATLFGREPDAEPMTGLAEWHHGDCAGFQLFASPDNAGHGVLTLIVPGVRGEHRRLAAAGLSPGEVETADYTTIVRLRDPDDNLVVLAQHGTA